MLFSFLCFLRFLCVWNPLVKKEKIKRFKTALIPSFTILLKCNSETSLGKPERSQWCLWVCVFNISHQRGLRDLQISPLWDVSEKLHETSQRCVWDKPMPAGKRNQPFNFGQLIVYKTKNIFLEKSWYYWWRNLFQKNQKSFLKKSKLSVSLNQKSKVLCSLFLSSFIESRVQITCF